MKKIFFIFMIIAAGTAFAQRKHVCVTIDDLPVAGGKLPGIAFQRSVTEKLLAALVRHHVPAIGFVNVKNASTRDTIDAQKLDLVDRWLASGMDIGNHTYSHPDYNAVSYDEFARDIVRGEPPLSALLMKYGKRLQYFRHPFLHRGDSKGKADSLRAFLRRRGYEEAPVTIDNSEWIYAAAYFKSFANGDTVHMRDVGASYVEYMEKKVRYYEGRSEVLFGRPIRQMLLIHANLLNADYFDALAAMFERNAYTFVPLAQALTDSVYSSPDTYYGKGGISWIDRWALTRGMKGDFFKDEPRVPEYIMKRANIDSE